ncbi:unnamed protein product [Gordionus sp. m RMFG-2023]
MDFSLSNSKDEDFQSTSQSQQEIEQFEELLSVEKLQHVPLLVYANKQDINGSSPASEIAQLLKLNLIRDRDWQIQACSAQTGEGIQEGFEWISSQLKAKK